MKPEWSNDDKIKAKNVANLFSNRTTRTVIVLTAVLIIGTIGLGYHGVSKTSNDSIVGTASTAKGPDVKHQPGTTGSPAQTQLQQEENAANLNLAQQQGQSSLPVLTGTQSINDPISLPTPSNQNPVVTTPNQVVNLNTQPQQVYATTPPSNAAVVTPTQMAPAVSADLDKQIKGYLTLWGPRSAPLSEQEFSYAGKKDNTQQATSQTSPAENQAAAPSAATAIRYVRAGTMVPAVLITPLNSDSPGPVLAQIQSGPLSGARLIGQMRAGKESILITFTQISKPGWPDVYGITAVGMDEQSSTALATDVNHHYIQRYLGLFGGAFLSGYGQAMQQQGQTVVRDPSGGVVIEQTALDNAQVLRSARGNVAQTAGEEWKKNSDRDTTIKVQGKAGAPYPIKVLFLGNF